MSGIGVIFPDLLPSKAKEIEKMQMRFSGRLFKHPQD